MMVMFLTGLVTIILMRTLRRDYARYARVRPGGTRLCSVARARVQHALAAGLLMMTQRGSCSGDLDMS